MTDLFNNEEIRMLSFWQPFAGLMLYDKVETRSWPTSYRGLILICSTLTPLEKQPIEVQQTIVMARNDRFMLDEVKHNDNIFALNGFAIAVGRLTESRKVRISDNTFFQHPPDLYAHIYKDVRRIEPFRIKGFQGLPRRINEETKSKIKYL